MKTDRDRGISRTILLGLTLFSMFFGAGNLIFPPLLGAQAQSSTISAMVGFSLTAIFLPMLGVYVANRNGTFMELADKINHAFSSVFIFCMYLSIGPMLAIPRTASTSFEMAVVPFMNTELNVTLFRVLYSIIFFAVALFVAFRPEKLSDKLGKITTPLLLILIVVIYISSLSIGFQGSSEPAARYAHSAFSSGFVDGYQTMDTIAALNFGIIFLVNMRAKKVRENELIKYTLTSGLIAGTIMLLVYSALAFIGVKSGMGDAANGTVILTSMVRQSFGHAGVAILGLIFILACFNTCVSLICAVSEYFTRIIPKVKYRTWVVFFTVISAIISNIGLDAIISISVPILNAIYPLAITLIVIGWIPKLVDRYIWACRMSLMFCGLVCVPLACSIDKVVPFYANLPLLSYGFAWLIPAVIGFVAGLVYDIILKSRTEKTE